MKTQWTEQILHLIHDRPCIRQVEISDAVDCDMDQVERSIQEHITSGLIIRFETPGPNGRMQLAYKIDPDTDPELLALMFPAAKVFTVSPSSVSPAASPPSFPTRETVRAPELPRNTAPSGMTKTEQAVEFIINAAKSGLTVTDDQLRGILGIKPGQYPATWLHMATKTGKIHKDGRFWKPGKPPTFSAERMAQLDTRLDAAAERAEAKRREATAPIVSPGVDIDVPVYRKQYPQQEVPAAVELPPPVVTPKIQISADALLQKGNEGMAQHLAREVGQNHAAAMEVIAREVVAEKAAAIEDELAKPTRKMCTMNCSETPKHPERQALCGDCLDVPVPQKLLNELSKKGRAEVENQIKEDAKKETKPLPVFGTEPFAPGKVWAAPEGEDPRDGVNRTGQLSMAIWNDGQLQLARGGRVTETLTLAEVTTLCAYLSNTIEVRRAAKEKEKAAK